MWSLPTVYRLGAGTNSLAVRCRANNWGGAMRRLFLTGGLLSSLVLVSASADQARAGLFDFLNQSAPEPQRTIERPVAPVELPPLLNPLPKARAEAPRHITVLHKMGPDKPAALTHQSAALMKDATLREGDAVMTQNGIRIFAGSSSDGHRVTDFVPLADTKGLETAERVALAEIDAHRSEDGWQSKSSGQDQLLTGRSAGNMAHAWKWVRDPKGVLVRYVGP